MRDEGTSYHYLPPAEFAEADPGAGRCGDGGALRSTELPVYRGAAWTTDAPFRETAGAIERCRARGILAVEMEAAALYAFARARESRCCAWRMSPTRWRSSGGDFEKGEADGAYASLTVIAPWRRPGARWDTDPREDAGRRRRCAIAIMAKAPRVGEAKTRLVPPMSAADAAALSACFIRDAAENIAAAAQQAPSTATSRIRRRGGGLNSHRCCRRRRGFCRRGGRGSARALYDAGEDLLAAGYGSVCLVNADSPTLPTSDPRRGGAGACTRPAIGSSSVPPKMAAIT